MGDAATAELFVAQWRETGGSELANTQSFINGLCALIGVPAPDGSRADDAFNDYVFERRVFQDNGDGTSSFGRIDAYRKGCFILEAKQGSEGDRAAADKGDADLDLFGQTAAARMKRGTARRGTPGWAKAMVEAKGQAERYAKALPLDHGWPPFLLVTDIGYCIEVYADFSGSGKAYAQFPDRASFRIMLNDLHDPKVRTRLAAIWTAPHSLNPATIAAKATRDIADVLARLARRLEARGHGPEQVSGFLMRLLFTMFAEDTHLIPKGSFTELLIRTRPAPHTLHHQLSALWQSMDAGEFSPALGADIRKFNGYLFKDRSAIPLEAGELDVLIEAAKADWTQVEPAIFGTLLERALNAKERAKLGAHYTPRAYVERLVMPTIIEPLRADWAGVRGAATQLLEAGKTDEARRTVKAFHGRLAGTKVLDPACGTGNFLYVAMARMKELEGEVIELLTELEEDQYVAELSGHTITPENFLGIEINPRAAAIAQLVLWIGYLQWHFRVAGKGRMPAEPILKDIRTIENRDALINYDEKLLERDERGVPLSTWDGETMKPHPVTGKPVPDEAARREVYRYVKPRAATWPRADFIIGNPPFIGGKDIRERLGSGYFEALFKTTDVPESADFVMHWWDIAASAVARKTARAGKGDGLLLTVSGESDAPEVVRFHEPQLGRINSDLRVGADVASATALKANEGLSSPGVKLHGDGFIVMPEVAASLGDITPARIRSGAPSETQVIFAYRNGRDLAAHPRGVMVIDLFGLSEAEVRADYPAIYQHIFVMVKPHRDENNRASYRNNWWLYVEARSELRKALAGVDRYIVTIETAKHRVFQFLPVETVPDNMLVCTALDDAFFLGVMSSRFHMLWAVTAGGRMGMGDDPRYNKTRCFDPFPFPTDVPEPLKDRLRAEAEALDGLRKRVLAEHDDLTLTGLYNVLTLLRAEQPLTPKDRDVHDRGLVTILRQHHGAIDALVAEAYGWGADHAAGPLTDAEILTRRVALNHARTAEEAAGHIRWLRPDYQAPNEAPKTTGSLDLGETAPLPIVATILPWPQTLPEQVSAIAGLLSSAPTPLHPRDVARAFKAKQASTMIPVLDSLTAIGMARKLADGRYAA